MLLSSINGMTRWDDKSKRFRDNNITRRKNYNANIIKPTFFAVKHLKKFIYDSITTYVSAGKSVLDIGCGEQPMRGLIEKYGGAYIGLDISQNQQGSVAVIASINKAPFHNSSFDLILCTEVLEHVSDTYSTFSELSRLLRPGGIIILTSPFAFSLHEEPYDYIRVTPYQVTECAKNSNLEIVELKISGNELEVMATVWDIMWSSIGKNKLWGKILKVIMRLPVNLIVLLLSLLLNSVLPKKYYLHTLCILIKNLLQ